jgi:hypothetical protein
MMTLRPKHSFESVVGNLATGLSSGTIRLATDSRKSAAEKPGQTSHYTAANVSRQSTPLKDDSALLNPLVSSSKK